MGHGGAFVLRVDDANASSAPAIDVSGIDLGASPVGQITVLDGGVSSGGSMTCSSVTAWAQ